MAAGAEHETNASHWLNWCRLCAKDDIRGNVKVYNSGEHHGNAWNSVLLLAVRKYFDVHMRLEDELSGVLCKECYTLISELIDFAEHVNKVQAIFELLRRSEQDKQLDLAALRTQYGLRETDWTHIIKPVSEIEHNSGSRQAVDELPKQEFIDLGEQLKPLENAQESITDQLAVEEILVAGWQAKANNTDNLIKRPRGRRRATKTEQKATIKEEPATETEQNIMEADEDLEFLPESASPEAAADETLDYINSSDREDDADNNSDGSSKRRNMKCDSCGKLYHNPASYQKHLLHGCHKTERTKMDKSTYCELCNKTLSSTAALKLHKQGMHFNAKPFICDHCGKQLKTITALNEHKLVHTEERPFSCAICRAGFKNRARLKVHYQIHEEPNYVCNICGKKLQTRRTWNMHKLVHSEERKFNCDVCGALFKRSKTLKTHLLGHTGLRPYVCNYCGQTFACNANCRAHKLKKHPIEFKRDENECLTSRVSVPTLEELRVMSQKIPKVTADSSN